MISSTNNVGVNRKCIPAIRECIHLAGQPGGVVLLGEILSMISVGLLIFAALSLSACNSDSHDSTPPVSDFSNLEQFDTPFLDMSGTSIDGKNPEGPSFTKVIPPGDGQLIYDAIEAANTTGTPLYIKLSAGVYTLPPLFLCFSPECLGIDDPRTLIKVRVTIQGAGRGKTIIQRNDGSDGKAFYISSTGKLVVRGVTLEGGGGGIDNEGEVLMKNVIVRNGTDTGITNTGSVKIQNSSIIDNVGFSGGGIANSGDSASLVISGSIIARNRGTESGGGIFSTGGTVKILTSTISDNSGGEAFGGVLNSVNSKLIIRDSAIVRNKAAVGGGLYNGGKLFATGVTIANNVASVGGGIFVGAGSAKTTLKNVTITGNGCVNCEGGGIAIGHEKPIVNLQNTILANNIGVTGPDCLGSLNSWGGNLFGEAGVVAGGCIVRYVATDIVAASLLGDLLDNRRPRHAHVPLLAGSPAIDNAKNGACRSLDQLGLPRVDGDQNGSVLCDIGAVEYSPILVGDLDLDGDVDKRDRNILRSALGTSASGPDDPRDLNGDGKITTADVRLLSNLCTLPYCAVN